MTNDTRTLPETVIGNIDAVVELEEEAERDTSTLSRVAHGVGTVAGSVPFAAFHLAAIAGWLLLNSGIWPATVFDPFPFTLLGTIVSSESVLLTTFVLIKQNREGDRAEKRSHLDLQVNLLTEREVTKVLQLLRHLADRLDAGVPHDTELKQMAEYTAVDRVARHLEDRQSGKADTRR